MRCQDVLPAVGPKPTRTRALAWMTWLVLSERCVAVVRSGYVAFTFLGALPKEPSPATRSATRALSRAPKITVALCLVVTLSPAVSTFRNSISSVVGRYRPTNGVNSTLPCPARRIGAAARTNAATQPAGLASDGMDRCDRSPRIGTSFGEWKGHPTACQRCGLEPRGDRAKMRQEGGGMRQPLQAQLQPPVVEATVHPELRDAPAVDEAAEADVRGLHLRIGVGVEDVLPAERQPKARAQFVRQVEIEERLGAELLVQGRVCRVVVPDRAVIRGPSEPCKATKAVAGGERALGARQRILEAIAIFGVQDPGPNRREIGPERIGHGLRHIYAQHLGLREVRRAGERQGAAPELAPVGGHEGDSRGACIA